MVKKIIAVLGSPIPDGNTAKLLNQSIKGATDAGCEVELVDVTKMDFSPCMEYLFCLENDTCIMEDEITQFYKKFREMDGLIVATPVMTMGIPGKLKSFMDRFQVFYNAKYERNQPLISKEHKENRKTLFISIGGMKNPNDFDGVKLSMLAFCDIIDCPYWDEILQDDMDTIKDITTRQDLMDKAYKKAHEMATLIINNG